MATINKPQPDVATWRWDLSGLYSGCDDERLLADHEKVLELLNNSMLPARGSLLQGWVKHWKGWNESSLLATVFIYIWI